MKYGIFIQGAFANGSTRAMMLNHPSNKFYNVQNIHAADVVVWTGGADISPKIYNSTAIPGTNYSTFRDADDLAAIGKSEGKVLIGICRGAQLLNCVPNHGTLWQDVNNHAGSNHKIVDYITGKEGICNSLHHQMMRPTHKALIVAGNKLATRKDTYEDCWRRENTDYPEHERYDIDPEVVWYEDTKSLLFQGHPEFGHNQTTNYFYELIDRYVLPALENKLNPESQDVNSDVGELQEAYKLRIQGKAI